MVTRRQTTTYRDDVLGTVQYIIGLVIAIIFGLSLVPFSYGDMFYLVLGIIVVQMIISLIRFRILNFMLETIILIFAIIGIVPFLIGYIFRLLVIPITIIDMATFKSTTIYKKVEIITANNIKRTRRTKNGKPIKSKTKITKKPRSKVKVKDAEFTEK